jgi:hypothetical protein
VSADPKPERSKERPDAVVSNGGKSAWFAFSSRRAQSQGRRLFAAQRRVISTIFETKAQRPHAILRMVTTHA